MLELTEASSVPPNQNTSVTTPNCTGVAVMPHDVMYTRDVAITAVFCFIGGVGLTLLVVLVCYQAFRRKKLKESRREKEEEEGGSTVANHCVVNENGRDVFLQASSVKPRDREIVLLDARYQDHIGQFRSRVNEDSSHFGCPDCCAKAEMVVGPNPMRWNQEMAAEEEIEKSGMSTLSQGDRRKAGNRQGILSRNIPDKLLSPTDFKCSSHHWRQIFSEKAETLSTYETGRDIHNYGINIEGKSTGYDTLHCKSCHRTYRPPQQTVRPGRIDHNMREAGVFNGFSSQHKLIDKGRNYNHIDGMKNTEAKRGSRNVTFDLDCLRTLEQGNFQGKDKWEEGARTSRDKENVQEKRQSSRLLKVKLNLNPLRKNKIHPKRKHEQKHSERSSSRKSHEKRHHGKDRRQKQSKEKSVNKTKGSDEKLKKSSKSKESSGGGVEEKEEEDKGKSKTSEEEGQKSMKGSQGENTGPDNCKSDDPPITEQSASAVASGQVLQNLQSGPVEYQGSGMVLGSSDLPYMNPFSVSAAERNHTTTLPLMGSAGSQLAGSSISLHGGNFLLSTMAPAFNPLLPSGPANSAAPSKASSGPNLASSGSVGSFSRQTHPAASLLANTVNANPLQTAAIQSALPQNSQAGALALNLTSKPAVNPEAVQFLSQSLMSHSSLLAGRMKADPTQGPHLQTINGLHQMPPESQAPQSLERLPIQAQVPDPDGLSGLASQGLASGTPVENLSNNSQTDTGRVHGGSALLAEGPAVGLSGDNIEAANVSVSGLSGFSADDAAVLLHQDYLSEEGDSSPRRKLRLALPEKTSSRPPTALEKKIR
ncbi:hypothetical protein Q5P01_010614 [Channa striata]|uniref:Uncharacterized protein n=1 Tax=Channa striata TaxID=64152 RepID=A0AA88SM19_CHASR|nr:hypothetical protein Q5P01_010614 [Channa striata]